MNPAFPAKSVAALLAACLTVTWSLADERTKAEKAVADSMLGKEAGDVRDDNGLKMKLVWCPPGFVPMEWVENGEVTTVNAFVTRGYWLGKFEVTRAEWKRFAERKGFRGTEPWTGYLKQEGDDFPATHVSWDDAMEFCRTLTEQERKAGRLPDAWEYTLPTEAQWERACRAGMNTTFSFGDDSAKLGEYAWYYNNASDVDEKYPHRVGLKKPNPWGLYDMHGNVCERCLDYYAQKLPGGRDPEVTEKARHTVVKGGCWNDAAADCKSAIRDVVLPTARGECGGFRVALTPVPPAP